MINKLTIFPQSFLAEPKRKAIAALAIGLIVFCFVPILVRLGENEISPTAVTFHRLWIPMVLLGLWNGLSVLRQGFQNGLNQWKGLTSRTIKILLGCGLCFAATQLLWAWFLTQTSVANSALLHSFTPLFATVGGWIFLAQNFDRRFVIGMIIAIIGSLILGFDDFLQSTHQIQGDIIALTSAFFLAVYFLLVEKIRDQLEPINIIFYCCVVGTLVSIPFLLINQAPILPFSANGLLIIITLAFSLLVLHLLTAYALKFLSSALVGVVLLIEPILSAILAWVIFSETLNFWNLVAFPLILWGIYVATTSKSVIKDEPQIQ